MRGRSYKRREIRHPPSHTPHTPPSGRSKTKFRFRLYFHSSCVVPVRNAPSSRSGRNIRARSSVSSVYLVAKDKTHVSRRREPTRRTTFASCEKGWPRFHAGRRRWSASSRSVPSLNIAAIERVTFPAPKRQFSLFPYLISSLIVYLVLSLSLIILS